MSAEADARKGPDTEWVQSCATADTPHRGIEAGYQAVQAGRGRAARFE